MVYRANFLNLKGPRAPSQNCQKIPGMTGILGQLKWESLKKRRKDNRLILLFKGLKGKARIPTDDLIPNTRRGRNHTPWPFRYPLPAKMSISIASSPDYQGLE